MRTHTGDLLVTVGKHLDLLIVKLAESVAHDVKSDLRLLDRSGERDGQPDGLNRRLRIWIPQPHAVLRIAIPRLLRLKVLAILLADLLGAWPFILTRPLAFEFEEVALELFDLPSESTT